MMTITFNRPGIGTVAVTYDKLTNSPIEIDTTQWPMVPNQTRCFMKYTPNGFRMLPYCRDQYSDSYPKKLAIIVESPNSKEFDNNFNPIAPLIGRSGNTFDRKIVFKFNTWFNTTLSQASDISEGTIVRVELVNPVQFQTSLFHLLNNKIPYLQLKQAHKKYTLNKKLRDDVWKALYVDLKYEGDFIAEILKIAPDYIVNCCTGNSSSPVKRFLPISRVDAIGQKELKDIVRSSLYKAFITHSLDVPYIEDVHPRVW